MVWKHIACQYPAFLIPACFFSSFFMLHTLNLGSSWATFTLLWFDGRISAVTERERIAFFSKGVDGKFDWAQLVLLRSQKPQGLDSVCLAKMILLRLISRARGPEAVLVDVAIIINNSNMVSYEGPWSYGEMEFLRAAWDLSTWAAASQVTSFETKVPREKPPQTRLFEICMDNGQPAMESLRPKIPSQLQFQIQESSLWLFCDYTIVFIGCIRYYTIIKWWRMPKCFPEGEINRSNGNVLKCIYIYYIQTKENLTSSDLAPKDSSVVFLTAICWFHLLESIWSSKTQLHGWKLYYLRGSNSNEDIKAVLKFVMLIPWLTASGLAILQPVPANFEGQGWQSRIVWRWQGWSGKSV